MLDLVMFLEYSRLVRVKRIALKQRLSLKVYRFASLRLSIFSHQSITIAQAKSKQDVWEEAIVEEIFQDHRAPFR